MGNSALDHTLVDNLSRCIDRAQRGRDPLGLIVLGRTCPSLLVGWEGLRVAETPAGT